MDVGHIDADHSGSGHLRWAAVLLREGHDLDAIAERTEVPVALVEMLQRELIDGEAVVVGAQRGDGGQSDEHGFAALVLLAMAAICSVTLCVSIDGGQDPWVQVATALAGCVTVIAAILVAARLRSQQRGSGHRRH